MFDLILRNGTVVDGTGKAAFTADIAVLGDTITAIELLPPGTSAVCELDCAGSVIAPGFIDIHTHADIALLARPQHLPKVMQGVTTEVFTNCGLGFAPVTGQALEIQRRYLGGLFGDDGSLPSSASPAAEAGSADARLSSTSAQVVAADTDPDAASQTPHRRVDWQWRSVAEFLSRFEAQGMGANVVYLVPHGSVRVSAMGMADRAADPTELALMLEMVEQGMEEGAWGLSTGVWYAPMRAARREELVALCHAAGFFATHQRDYGETIFDATRESLEIAREAGVPLQIAHLQMNGAVNEGRAPDLLALLDRARHQGIDVTCDTYPYTAGSTFVQSMLPDWATDGGPEAILRRLSIPDTRERMIAALNDGRDWSRYQLVGADSPVNGPLDGLPFDEIASIRGMSVPEWICALLHEDALRACFVHHAAHEGNVRDILRWSGQMIGSDGLHLSGKCHPRLYGTFPRVLGHYVREEKVISLEQAVHKMTGMPARRLGLRRRGTLEVGHAADLVVFDPITVRDTASFESPLNYPIGISSVWINGQAVKWEDQPTGALPGRVLRRQ